MQQHLAAMRNAMTEMDPANRMRQYMARKQGQAMSATAANPAPPATGQVATDRMGNMMGAPAPTVDPNQRNMPGRYVPQTGTMQPQAPAQPKDPAAARTAALEAMRARMATMQGGQANMDGRLRGHANAQDRISDRRWRQTYG